MNRSILVLAIVVMFASTLCEAALWDRGSGLIYDDDLDVTWLQDVNYGQTSGYDDILYGYDTQGGMLWEDAITWANGLEYYDSIRGITWGDWRLPSAYNQDGSGPDTGPSPGSELGHLYFIELGNSEATHLTNTGPFLNLQKHVVVLGISKPIQFWTGDEHWIPVLAYSYCFKVGGQGMSHIADDFIFAWAVRDGDVEVIPTPSAVLLATLGFATAGCVWRQL